MIDPSGAFSLTDPSTAPDEFSDCEYCTHCVTVNEDMDNYCRLQNRVAHEVCVKFEHFEGKKKEPANV